MNTRFLLVAVAAISMSNCSVAYKTGQTPDDVYYSPVRAGAGYIASENNKDQSSYEDRTIRMSIRDPRWRDLDYDYSYSPYQYGYNSSYYYNPCYYPYPVYVVPYYVAPVNATPRMTNLSAYKSGYNNINSNNTVHYVARPASNQAQGNYNNSNNGLGSTLQKAFFQPSGYGTNNSSSSGYDNGSSSRDYTPSGSSSSSGSSSNSSSGGISRPARNGN